MILEQIKNMPKDSKIIDFGCGTGKMGELLHKAGFTYIVGVDGSSEMLETCKAKNVYKSLHECLVGSEELQLDEYDFDIAVSSACMIVGHFPNTCYKLFLQHLKQGGQFLFSIRDMYLNPETDKGMGYAQALYELVDDKKIDLVAEVPYVKYQGLYEFAEVITE